MTPRERILAAIEHRQTDHVPTGYDAHEVVTQRLYKHFGVSDLAGLYNALSSEGFSVFTTSYVYPKYIGPEPLQLSDGTKTDLFGIASQKHAPLAFAQNIRDLDRYRWPQADWFDYSTVKERCLRIKAGGRVTVGGEGGCGIIHAINLRGYEQGLTDPLTDPEFTEEYMRRMGDFFVEWNERWLAAAGGEFDIFRCGDELGNMQTMHCSPDIWRRFYKPQLKRIWAVAKSHGLKIWFHCCGYCRPAFEDLIEMGVDLWDPTPPAVRDNDLAEMKRLYGGRITFVGGVDQPRVLVSGTPADVEAEVKLRIEQLAPGGGYILGPSQVLTPDVPIENILALYRAAAKYGR